MVGELEEARQDLEQKARKEAEYFERHRAHLQDVQTAAKNARDRVKKLEVSIDDDRMRTAAFEARSVKSFTSTSATSSRGGFTPAASSMSHPLRREWDKHLPLSKSDEGRLRVRSRYRTSAKREGRPALARSGLRPGSLRNPVFSDVRTRA